MRRIYEAANNLEAHMVVHMLNDAGLEAHIHGEHLQSGAGELPLGGLVAVAVADEDVPAALRVIKEWEARTVTSSDNAPAREATRNFYGPFLAFVFGGMFGAGVVWSLHHGPERTSGMDWNDDGTLDERVYQRGSTVARIELDRNFDGKVDSIERYRLDGWVESVESDDDFDGRFDVKTIYRQRQPAETQFDANEDGSFEQRLAYRHGVPDTYEYLNSSGAIVKRIRYKGWKTDRAELDLDADGVWERSYRFDRYDEPVDIRTRN